MPTMDDDADLIFDQGRIADADAEGESLSGLDVQQLLAEAQPGGATPAAEATSPSIPTTPSPTEVPELPVDEPTTIEETEGKILPVEEEPDQPESSFRSIATAARNAPIMEAADILDNAAFLITDGMAALGFDIDAFERDAEGQRIPTLRPILDAAAGTPDTTGEQVAAGIAGQLAYIMPAMSLVKGAKVFGNASKLRTAATVLGAPAAVAAATQGSQEGNLSNLATEAGQGTIFDNAITRALAIDADDATIERMLKTAAEDVVLGTALEGVVAGVKGIRSWRSGREGIAEVVETTGTASDDVLVDAVEEMVSLRHQSAMLDAAEEAITTGRAAGDFAQTREGLSPAAADLFDQIESATKAKAEQGRRVLAESEARVATTATGTTADGRWIEAVRKAADDGNTTSPVNKALGRAADLADVAEPPKRNVIDNFLEADEADISSMRALADSGDWDEAAKTFGKILDNKNYDRITTDDEEGIKSLFKAAAAVFGNTKGSTRQQTTITLAETEEDAIALIAMHADESGTSLESIIQSLDDSMPDITDLRAKFNSMRMVEMSLAEQFNDIAIKQGTAEWDDLSRAQLMRTGTLLANVNDRISGISAEAGGLLSSHRINAKASNFNETLESSRRARNEQIGNIMESHGGAQNIDRIAEAARIGNDPSTTIKTLQAGFNSGATLGDTFYNAFVVNILSSPATQSVNITSNLGKVLIQNYAMGFIEAGAVAVKNGNVDAFKQWQHYLSGTMRGASSALGFAGGFRNGTVAQAFRTSRRITAGDAVKFAGESGAARALFSRQNLGDLVKRGVPVHVPTSGLWPGGKRQVPLFPVPKAGEAIGDYIQTRTGPGAKVFDFVARTMELPTKLLAAGDELASSINYHGTLNADALAQVQKMGLNGEEGSRMLNRILRDAPNVETLAKRVDLTDVDRQAYVQMLDRVNVAAQDSARRGTFTEPAGPAMDKFMEMRDLIPALRWFAPFVRTPTNLITSAVRDFSPVGPAFELGEAAANGALKSDESVAAAARFATISGVYAATWAASESGILQGSGPHNPAQRALWLEEVDADGVKNLPYSIKVNGRRISYNRFDPVAMPIGILADLQSVMGDAGADEGFEDLSLEFIGLMKEQLKSRSYVEGLSNLMHVIEAPERYARRMLVSTAENTIIPSSRFWAGVERGGVPIPDDLVANLSDEGAAGLLKEFVQGRPDKPQIEDQEPGLGGMFLQLGSTMAADLPAGASEAFEVFWEKVVTKMGSPELASASQRTFYGDIRSTPVGVGPNLFTPFSSSSNHQDPDPLTKELVRLGYGVSVNRMFGEVNGVKLNPKQQERYQKLFAIPKNQPTIREFLTSKMFEDDGATLSEAWNFRGDSIPDLAKGGKLQLIEKWVGKRKRRALKRLRQEDPALDAVLERVEDLPRDTKRKVGENSGSDLVQARKDLGEDLTTSATFAATRVDDPFNGALNE
jgi:hypothetical protein